MNQRDRKSDDGSDSEDRTASDTEDDCASTWSDGSNWSDGSDHDDVSDSEDDEGVPPTGYDSPISREGEAAGVGKAFYQAESEMDEWAVDNPDGLPAQIFLLDGDVDALITPPADPNKTRPLLDLPQEIRSRIYLFSMPNSFLSANAYAAPSRISEMQCPKDVVIEIDQNLTGLAILVKASLFHICRQIRYEGLREIFENTEFSISWLPSMEKFAQFLGKKGRVMVRCLTLWDHLDLKTYNTDLYLFCLKEVEAFPRIQDLVLILESHVRDTFDRAVPLYKFYIQRQECAEEDEAEVDSWPEIGQGHLSACWPEYGVLQRIAAQNFTLMLSSLSTFFGLGSGDVFEGLLKTMQWNAALNTNLALRASAPAANLVPAADLQDTTVPLYNFVRRLLDDATYKFFAFASSSMGGKVEDCALCYLAQDHCGYHDLPILYQNDADRDEFKALNYTEMRNIAREAAEGLMNGIYKDALAKVFIAMDFIGWPEVRDKSKHDLIDKCVDGGYKGAKGDKEGLTNLGYHGARSY